MYYLTTGTTATGIRRHAYYPFSNEKFVKYIAVLQQQWFLVGVVMAILCARVEPALGLTGGPLRPEYTIKILGVGCIFLLMGFQQRTSELRDEVMHFRLHVCIQTMSLFGAPLLMWMLSNTILPVIIPAAAIVNGFLVLSACPPPVSSAVILTKAVGGNTAAAIFNSTLGSFMGVFVTPFLILQLVTVASGGGGGGGGGSLDASSIYTSLTLTVLFPVIIGQLCRNSATARVIKQVDTYKNLGPFILICIIYNVFCETFHRDVPMNTSILFVCGFVVICFQFTMMSLIFFFVGRWLGFSRRDIIAFMFCSTHKSLTLGIPIINLMFKNDPDMIYYSLPLLLYHPCQILIGTLLTGVLREWVSSGKATRFDYHAGNTDGGGGGGGEGDGGDTVTLELVINKNPVDDVTTPTTAVTAATLERRTSPTITAASTTTTTTATTTSLDRLETGSDGGSMSSPS